MKKAVLTKQDRALLESYKRTVASLAAYLGEAYEIVLHSLEDPEHSVIQVINGFHTGRSIGDPITDLAINWLNKLEKEDSKNPVNEFCYYAKNKLGEPLKSATIAIRGSNNQIIGLICINLYLGTPAINLLSDLLPKESSVFATENFIAGTDRIMGEIKEAQEKVHLNNSLPALQQNKEIIRILYKRKVFDIKNSVEQVANALNISINTVYFHLRNIAKEDN